MGSICTLLAVEMFSGPVKRWPHQGGHLTGWANYVAQKVSGPPWSCSGCYWNGCSLFAFAILSLSLGHGNVFLDVTQEKTSPKPGGMFQPNLGRHISVTVFILEFVGDNFFFFFSPLLLLKLVPILDPFPLLLLHLSFLLGCCHYFFLFLNS